MRRWAFSGLILLLLPMAGGQDGESGLSILLEGEPAAADGAELPHGSNATVVLTLSPATNGTWNATIELTGAINVTLETGAMNGTKSFDWHLPTDEPGSHRIRADVDFAYLRQAEGNETGNETGANATMEWVEGPGATSSLSYRVLPPPGGLPVGLLVVGGVAVVAAGAAAVAIQRRRAKPKYVPRSQALRSEKGLEPPAAGGSRVVSSRSQEAAVVRPDPRLGILEEKIRDVDKTIELARARLEKGSITQFQFDKIRQNKEAERQRLQTELEGLQRDGVQR